MTEMERRALLGDKKAQAECTAKGIVLPCPCCGENGGRRHIAEGNHWYYCKECQVATRICGTIKDALAAWNTRPTPPAVDAVPVAHAQWKCCSDDGCEAYIACSHCGYEPTINTKTIYCPNCGAKMDKEAANAEK